MRAVVQRVARAAVTVDGGEVARIGQGLLVLVAVENGDTEREAGLLARKLAHLRIFPDARKPMNVDVRAAGGEALVVSQFTLAGDVTAGNRPSFLRSADPALAEPLYLRMAELLEAEGVATQTGKFAASMQVDLVNDGPVTFTLTVEPGGKVGN